MQTATRTDPDRRAGLGVSLGFVLSMLMALAVASTSVWALRAVSTTEADARRSALHLAEIEQLRLSLESRVAWWREYLLSRDEETAQQVDSAAQTFRTLLARLRDETGTAFAEDFDAVQKAEVAYHAEIEAALKLRGRTVADLAGAEAAARERIRPLRQQVERALEQLSQNARVRIEKDEDQIQRLERTATAVTVAAVAVLLIAGLFGLRLTREMRRAMTRERELRTSAEALADEVAQQSKDVEQRLREVSAELETVKMGRA